MKNFKLFVMSLAVFAILLSHSYSYGCNVCHSKNPKMVQMHKELEFKDCFKCHHPGAKKTPEEQKAQMVNDQLCVRCHKK